MILGKVTFRIFSGLKARLVLLRKLFHSSSSGVPSIE